MKRLADYIMAIDDALPVDYCNRLIERYENSIPKDSSHEWDRDYRSFHEITIDDDEVSNIEDDKILWDAVKNVHEFYKTKCSIDFFPQNYGFEAARMKKYEANDKDQFGWHTDVGDYPSARRYLVMFFYLNDVEEGGHTVFDDKINDESNLFVKPKQGRVVVFPPMWMYPHKGAKPISGPKYILSSYAHYL